MQQHRKKRVAEDVVRMYLDPNSLNFFLQGSDPRGFGVKLAQKEYVESEEQKNHYSKGRDRKDIIFLR